MIGKCPNTKNIKGEFYWTRVIITPLDNSQRDWNSNMKISFLYDRLYLKMLSPFTDWNKCL